MKYEEAKMGIIYFDEDIFTGCLDVSNGSGSGTGWGELEPETTNGLDS